MNNSLAEIEAQIGSAPVERLPELMGQLERLRAQAWMRMLTASSTKLNNASGAECLLTLAEVAQRLSIPKTRAYELARQHKLPTVKIGKYVRVRLGKFEEYEKSLSR